MNINKNLPCVLVALFIIYLTGCSSGEEKQENTLYEVEISEAFQNNSEVNTSEFSAGEIEYVLLDSEKSHLLAQNPWFHVSEEEIFAFTRRQIYVFDRRTGAFIREIGHYGKDPGGYQYVRESFAYDEEKELIYTTGWDSKSYFRYSTDGGLMDEVFAYSIDLEQDMQNNVFGEIVTSMAPLNDTCFVGYVWNINGKQKAKLIVFNDNDHRIKIYPQHNHFDYDINRDGISVYSWNAKYYKLNRQLHFFERFTDTVFTVSADTLLPKFVLNRGETDNANATNYTQQRGVVEYLPVEKIFEADRFLFFKVRKPLENFESEYYYGFFDKENQNTKVSQNTGGIENDTDNFIPFPFISANQNNELVGFKEAYEIKQWFVENPEKAAQLPAHLQELKNINETDNPVVMIVKLKE